MITKSRNMLAALVATTAIAAFSVPAGAQMFENAWHGTARDGLSTALIMKQVDSGMFDNSGSTQTLSAGSSSSEVLLCGGDGSEGSTAGAQANSSCIILGDGANAIIDLGQASDGDQNANSDVGAGDLSDALENLTNGG